MEKEKMGNYRFKLSELIPNAWFYKLRDMAKSKHHNTILKRQTLPTPCRRSSNSPGIRLRHRPTVSSSTTSGHSTATGTGSFSPEFRSDQLLLPDHESSLHSPCSSKMSKAATFTPPPELDLRPIITKPCSMRKASPAPGVRLRMRSPRIITRKSGVMRRGSTATAAAAAVVKTSVDPKKDFKESMEEMIKENNIRASKDLEDLLACYLSLNSNEYHHIIINVFKQIWLDLNHLNST